MSNDHQSNTPRPVVIADYDPEWPEIYRSEEILIRNTCGELLRSLRHVGSTAVQGLAAKPVIDIMGGVSNLSDADSMIQALESVGYGYVSEYEDVMPDRRYFRKSSSGNRFHLHIVRTN